jgi:hypothetical protein
MAGVGGTAGKGGSAGQGNSSGVAGVAVLGEDECEERLTAIDRSCSVDADCALGTWSHCTIYDRTELLGISADALAELSELARLCGRPSEPNDCPGEGGGISPTVTDDGLEPWREALTPAAACLEGRCASYSTRCGRDVCGNGTIDRCVATATNPPTFEPATEGPGLAIEDCDRQFFGGLTCVDYGYARGDLRCLENSCVTDPSECVVCAEPSGPLVDCRTDEIGRVQWFELAASDLELAVLSLGGEGVRLARFARDLAPLGEVVIPSSQTPIAWGEGALARAAGAWVAVVTHINPPGYGLYVLPDGGELEERARVSGGEYRDPFLIARPDGGPLFVYGVPANDGFGSTQALPVADDLQSFGTGRGIGNVPVKSGTWVGSAYLLGTVVDGQADLLRLDPELAAAPERVAQMTFGGVWELLLGSDGETAFVLHHAPGTDSWMVPVDAMGMATGAALGVGVLGSPGVPVVFGGGAFVPTAVASNNAPTSGVRLVGGAANQPVDGELIASPADFPQAVRLGEELVVAFSNEDGLGLARYRP